MKILVGGREECVVDGGRCIDARRLLARRSRERASQKTKHNKRGFPNWILERVVSVLISFFVECARSFGWIRWGKKKSLAMN